MSAKEKERSCMAISSVGFNNNVNFGTLYTNPSGKKVDVSDNAIQQARTMTYIRNTVDKAMETCPQEVLNDARGNCYDEKLYFTIDENGKCVISNEKIPRVVYKGTINSGNCSLSERRASEINACKQISKITEFYSDENGAIRANGSGYKFAHAFPGGQFEIHHPEWAPTDIEE